MRYLQKFCAFPVAKQSLLLTFVAELPGSNQLKFLALNPTINKNREKIGPVI